jgi:uncharacterized membrane protein YhaH (DUF805 family)
MDFWSAVKSAYSKYATFAGRAPRSEYWSFFLFYVLLAIVASILDIALFGYTGAFYAIVALANLIPSLAVTVRRLHDTDRSGWWFFIGLVPLIGAIVLLIWFCTRGTQGANRFGEDPLGQAPLDQVRA